MSRSEAISQGYVDTDPLPATWTVKDDGLNALPTQPKQQRTEIVGAYDNDRRVGIADKPWAHRRSAGTRSMHVGEQTQTGLIVDDFDQRS